MLLVAMLVLTGFFFRYFLKEKESPPVIWSLTKIFSVQSVFCRQGFRCQNLALADRDAADKDYWFSFGWQEFF